MKEKRSKPIAEVPMALRGHVLQGMMHTLVVHESLEHMRRRLRGVARELETLKKQTASPELKMLSAKCAEFMRAIAESASIASDVNADCGKCFGRMVAGNPVVGSSHFDVDNS
jgi:hypothetical protein